MTDIVERLGVRPVINAFGHISELGNSLIRAEVLDAMHAIAPHFVDVHGLHQKAGERIAQLVGVEAAYVTAGAAAGLAISSAACMAGTDPQRVDQLPDTTGMRNELVVHRCQQNDWLQAARMTGASIVEIGSEDGARVDELRAAIGARTAAIMYFPDHREEISIPLESVVKVARETDTSLIVDAAAELPPVGNLRHYVDLGADLVIFSGGKMLRGPQCSGLILGRADLIRACARNASPNTSIGRPMKIGKEEIVGLVAAVEAFMDIDEPTEQARWDRMVQSCAAILSEAPGIRTSRLQPAQDDVLPRLVPKLQVSFEGNDIDVDALQRALLAGEPSVAVQAWEGSLLVNPVTLREGEEQTVARRILEAVSELS